MREVSAGAETAFDVPMYRCANVPIKQPVVNSDFFPFSPREPGLKA